MITAVILDIKKNHIKKDLKELYYKRNHVKDQKIQVERFSKLIYYKLVLIGRPNWSQFFFTVKIGPVPCKQNMPRKSPEAEQRGEAGLVQSHVTF